MCERDRKPSSVVDDHLSRPGVAARAQAIAKARRAAAYAFIASCIRWGLQHGQVARPWVSSYLAFPSLPGEAPGGISLLHSPWSRLHRPLAGTLPCDARTFLIPFRARDRLVTSHMAYDTPAGAPCQAPLDKSRVMRYDGFINFIQPRKAMKERVACHRVRRETPPGERGRRGAGEHGSGADG